MRDRHPISCPCARALAHASAVGAILLRAAAAVAGVTPQFYGLGHLPGGAITDFTIAYAASSAGVVVGYGYVGNDFYPFKWTAQGGIALLALPTGATDAAATGISADGSMITGYASTPSGSRPAAWGPSGPFLIPLPTGASSGACSAVSADGSSVAGGCSTPQGQRAFLWTQASGTSLALAPLAGVSGGSYAYGISADGTTIVGYSGVVGAGTHRATTWTLGGAGVGIGDVAGGANDTIAYAASGDGSVIIGDAGMAVGGRQAFRWSASAGAVGLGTFVSGGVRYSYGRGVSADGAIVTGYSTTPSFQEAFIWSHDTGIQNVQQQLALYGIDTSSWLVAYANGISPDGTMILGYGIHLGNTEAFVAVLPHPCYANCDNSTSPPALNVSDFTCFLQKFTGGDPYANCDSSTLPPTLNVADFTCFLQKFGQGCP